MTPQSIEKSHEKPRNAAGNSPCGDRAPDGQVWRSSEDSPLEQGAGHARPDADAEGAAEEVRPPLRAFFPQFVEDRALGEDDSHRGCLDDEQDESDHAGFFGAMSSESFFSAAAAAAFFAAAAFARAFWLHLEQPERVDFFTMVGPSISPVACIAQ